MSGDPERLLSASSGADAFERELLGSVRHVGPPDDAKDRAWRSIAAQIAIGAALGTASTSTAAAAGKATATGIASWALSTKILAVALVSSVAVGGGYLATRPSAPRPSVAVQNAVAPPVAALPRPVARQATPPEEAASPALPTPTAEAPSHKPEVSRPDSLRAESALLGEARTALRGGNAAGAQAALDKLQQQFPKGVLSQEREVLAIEVLYARGNVDGAKRRAQAFIKQYPKSPHSQKLARYLD